MELKPITGVLVNYYFICKRKLWFFANHIGLEQNSELVEWGKLIDETTFKREKKHILIDNLINIDFVGLKGYINETKKSDKMTEADLYQVKYYLYYLKKKGVEVKAIIHYPKIKKRKIVELTQKDERTINNVLYNIETIIASSKPPAVDKLPICRKCSYYELCYI